MGLDKAFVQDLGFDLPIARNPHAEPITYVKFRQLLEVFHHDLHAIESLLEKEDGSEFYLPLDLLRMRMDVNLDGECEESESMPCI